MLRRASPMSTNGPSQGPRFVLSSSESTTPTGISSSDCWKQTACCTPEGVAHPTLYHPPIPFRQPCLGRIKLLQALQSPRQQAMANHSAATSAFSRIASCSSKSKDAAFGQHQLLTPSHVPSTIIRPECASVVSSFCSVCFTRSKLKTAFGVNTAGVFANALSSCVKMGTLLVLLSLLAMYDPFKPCLRLPLHCKPEPNKDSAKKRMQNTKKNTDNRLPAASLNVTVLVNSCKSPTSLHMQDRCMFLGVE